jgi:hypothetical protein
MSEGFYVKFLSSVSDPLYHDLNKTSDFWTKLFPANKFEGRYEAALVDCILKNTCAILRKDRTYYIQISPIDWPVVNDQHVIEKINSFEYPSVTLLYNEFGTMNKLCIFKVISIQRKRVNQH